MADLKIPNLSKRSDKYIFKKKLSLRRKSKQKLLKESLLMVLVSFFIIYLNYLIPGKEKAFMAFGSNFKNIYQILVELSSYIYGVFLVIFVIFSLVLSSILILGSLSRVFKVIKRKTRQIPLR